MPKSLFKDEDRRCIVCPVTDASVNSCDVDGLDPDNLRVEGAGAGGSSDGDADSGDRGAGDLESGASAADAPDVRFAVEEERDTPYADVIFDYCDVLLDWRPRLALEGQAPAGVLDWFFDVRTPYGFWHYDALSDAGVSEETIIADFARHHRDGVGRAPADGSDADDAASLFRTYFERQDLALHGLVPGMAELLADLDAAGVRPWGLTNFTARFVHAAWDRFPALGLLRDTVVSSEEGVRKPDPEIYRRAIRRFGVNPAATAFVDDKARNARASRTVGLNGVRFADADQARAALLGE